MGIGTLRTPGTTNSSTKTPAPTIAPTALMPSQSAVRRSPGFPARARRFSVVCVKDVLATRATEPESRPTSGRTVRSMNGCWSSSSSRFAACIVPSWVSRACTGSTGDLPAMPTKMRRIAPAVTAAMTRGRGSMGQTSMSTILRMNMKPRNIMNPPNTRMMTPPGSPMSETRSSNMGDMNPGAAMNRNPARPIGRKPTT